jgi:chaperonin GroES
MKKKTVKSKQAIMPLSDRVLIMPLTDESKVTDAGIIIPETIDKERPEQGKVVAVGQGKYDDGKLNPMTVKVGDIVLFSKYGYDEIKVDGVEYLILKEENILAVINRK